MAAPLHRVHREQYEQVERKEGGFGGLIGLGMLSWKIAIMATVQFVHLCKRVLLQGFAHQSYIFK